MKTQIIKKQLNKNSWVETSVKDGMKNGIEKTFSNGVLVSETNYVDGIKDGVEKIYAYGELIKEITYENGVKKKTTSIPEEIVKKQTIHKKGGKKCTIDSNELTNSPAKNFTSLVNNVTKTINDCFTWGQSHIAQIENNNYYKIRNNDLTSSYDSPSKIFNSIKENCISEYLEILNNPEYDGKNMILNNYNNKDKTLINDIIDGSIKMTLERYISCKEYNNVTRFIRGGAKFSKYGKEKYNLYMNLILKKEIKKSFPTIDNIQNELNSIINNSKNIVHNVKDLFKDMLDEICKKISLKYGKLNKNAAIKLIENEFIEGSYVKNILIKKTNNNEERINLMYGLIENIFNQYTGNKNNKINPKFENEEIKEYYNNKLDYVYKGFYAGTNKKNANMLKKMLNKIIGIKIIDSKLDSKDAVNNLINDSLKKLCKKLRERERQNAKK